MQILPVAKSGWFFWLCSVEHGSVFRFGGSHRWYLLLARGVCVANWLCWPMDSGVADADRSSWLLGQAILWFSSNDVSFMCSGRAHNLGGAVMKKTQSAS